MERTIKQHRAAVDEWRETAPDDEALFADDQKGKKRRHRDLAQLSSLMAFYRRPDGVKEGGEAKSEPALKSNWSLTPANDNRGPGEGSGTEQAVEYIPSLDAINASLANVKLTYRSEPMVEGGGLPLWKQASDDDRTAKREVHGTPTGGDVEYGYFVDTHIDYDGVRHEKKHRTITRIGRLRFSDGTQTEPGFKVSEGRVIAVNLRMPVGAMLRTREKAARDKGSLPDPVETARTNAYFSEKRTAKKIGGLFQAKKPNRVRKKSMPKNRLVLTKTEERQMLADAYANTPVLPEIKKYPDGLPAGPRNLAHLWPGLVKVATGDSGSQAWEGLASGLEARNEWHVTLQNMKDEHVETLTKAMSANSLEELGRLKGYKGKYAIEVGKRILIAANDNFLLAREIASAA